MTFIVRVSDPTCPSAERIMESAKALAEAGDNPLKALAELHDNPTEILFDLDNPGDEKAFSKIYGEELRMRTIHLEEGETFTVTCVKRVDDWEDAPVLGDEPQDEKPTLAVPLQDCPACKVRPAIIHSPVKGYLIRCPECGADAGIWERRLAAAIDRWNGGSA